MTRRPVTVGVAGALACLAGLVALAAPVAAAGYDSTTEALLRGLNRKLLLTAIPITLLVEGLLIYATIRFHFSDEPKPTRENRKLELAMVTAIALILVFVGASSYVVLADPAVSDTPDEYERPENAVAVEVVSQQWFWEVHYPEENVTVRNEIVLPVDRPVIINTTSTDVIHAIHAPGLGLKQDAIPGQWNTIWTTPTDRGSYRLYCAEYCGAGHSKMMGTVRVVSGDEYRQWLERNEGAAAADGNATARGNATTGGNAAATGGATETETAAAAAHVTSG